MATYRLQLNSKYRLADAAKIIPYLRKLGISHIYASPLLRARRDSTHCYDVVSHSEINPQIAVPEEFEDFVTLLHRNKMGLLLDIVPNHMAANVENSNWLDVLEYGLDSKYADFFDIDWESDSGKKGRVVLPILQGSLETEIESGSLRLASAPSSGLPICLALYETMMPVSIRSYGFVLKRILERTKSPEISSRVSHVLRDICLINSERTLANNSTGKDEERIKSDLISALTESNGLRNSLKKEFQDINDFVRRDCKWKEFHDFLTSQNYELECWRKASAKLNYRRFFYINDLVALRTERDSVFRESHSLLTEWLKDGKIDALRVDHVDGLRDPMQYFERLRNLGTKSENVQSGSQTNKNRYIVAEKILTPGEDLHHGWKISGTTGYDFLRLVNGVFVKTQNESDLVEAYERFVKSRKAFEQIAYESKLRILKAFMQSDVERLIQLALRCKPKEDFRNVRKKELRTAIEQTAAHFPVYRTYWRSQNRGLRKCDREMILGALDKAMNRRSAVKSDSFKLLKSLLLHSDGQRNLLSQEFAYRFQQLTPTVVAKGMEDTAFYRFGPLASLNEVGCVPSEFGIELDEFHSANLKTQRLWPHALLTTSTHDTKRSEDARARINVLSELVEEWIDALREWSNINRGYKTLVRGKWAPNRNDEYLFYQSLISVLPETSEGRIRPELESRLQSFMLKAAKEQKLSTSWINPNTDYEEALKRFVCKVLDFHSNKQFIEGVHQLLRKVAGFGRYNSLSQLLLKLTCPGVPDIYQGCEKWNFRLVDPDNRQPVDYEVQQNTLEELNRKIKLDSRSEICRSLLRGQKNGMIKTFILKSVLNFRRSNQDLFNFGNYVPIKTNGMLSDNIIAFARRHAGREIIVVVPRFLSRVVDLEQYPVGPVWKNTWLELPTMNGRRYENLFTHEEVQTESKQNKNILKISEVFSQFPFALLSKR